jgi:protein-tyrosine phosphatase
VNGVYWIYRDASAPDLPAQRALGHVAPVRRSPKTGGWAEQVPTPLAIVLCPRGGSALYQDLLKLRRAGIDVLVSMLSDDQIDMLELQQEALIAERLGMSFVHHAIPDHQIPGNPHAFRALVHDLAQRLRDGHRVGIHCWGSIGRAPLTTACTLIHLGWKPQAALAAIESARGCEVPETEEQRQWVLNFKAPA